MTNVRIGSLAWIAVSFVLAMKPATVLAADKAARPNIIFIMADDLGYGDLGCFGQKRIRTPNIDRLAAEGMKLTDFYAGSTVCAPSRCVLMTGLHTGHCFIRGNGKINLRPDDVTVAEVLKQAGYTCGLSGKWGLGHEKSSGLPTRQGFDHFFGYLDQHHAHNYYPSFLVRGEKRVALRNVVPREGRFGQGVATKQVDYSHDLIMTDALGWLEEVHKRPFFLYLSLTIPHANNEAGRQGMEVPDLGDYAKTDWPEIQKATAAMIGRLDRDVGRLMGMLKRLAIDRNTVVFFTSDNGPHREGGNNPDFFDSNGKLRGIKRDLYEGGIRVPTIVRWPGHIASGSTSGVVGSFADVLPTLADLAGGSVPEGIDGLSIVPTLTGNPKSQELHKYLYWEFYERGGTRAVRMGEWKAVAKSFFGKELELYHLPTDLGEQKNVAAEHPEIVARALAAMKDAHRPSPMWKVRGRRVKKKPGAAKKK
ncbi:MAG: arylsulfatase [Planctomycetota bacterium]|nr:arylsulfatase [Planctomycetota bacterium]